MTTRSGRALLEELWSDVPPSPGPFRAEGQPPILKHAVRDGAPRATAVRLRMRGSIRLGRWRDFRGEEVIHLRRGFVWRARAGVISGFDALVDGAARLRWTLLGVVPVATAHGPDVARSAAGRWMLESIWLPTMLLLEEGARWERSTVRLARAGESGALELTSDADGRLQAFRMARWGIPHGEGFGLYPFGGLAEEERRFGDYTLPSRLRVGWFFGSDRWTDGEFFRAALESADFR